MKKQYIAALLFFFALVGLVLWIDSAPDIEAAPLSADQIEEQDLIAKIQVGSQIWQNAKDIEDDARAERIRQEQGNAGYRHALCTKFQKIVTGSGTVIDAQLSSDGSSCLAVQGF